MSTLNVTNLKHGSSSTNAIVFASDGTCDVKASNISGHKNIIINGSMQVAQRSTSDTANGYKTVDRWNTEIGGHDELATRAQVDVSSGTDPYNLGFRKALKITNGNQTSGAGAADYMCFFQPIEAQDIANSGWNYVSSSSDITLSFWVKASVAKTYYFYVATPDGTKQSYPMETGSLSANTWTKVTKTIPGTANITVDNDNGAGMELLFWPYIGTNYTDSGVSLNAWGAYSGSARTPVDGTTWWTTNDATFEITGVQLEVGDTATTFEHRTYNDEKRKCERYCQKFTVPSSDSKRATNITATVHGGGDAVYLNIAFAPMRAAPSLSVSGTFKGNVFSGSWTKDTLSSFVADFGSDTTATLGFHGIAYASISSSRTVGLTGQIISDNSNAASLTFDAEL